MIYLERDDVIQLHSMLIAQSGGSAGVRDPGLLDSAIAQPQMSFGGVDLYPSIEEKAGALGFSLIKNHAFIDGNKRIGHAAMESFLVLNGYEIKAGVDEQEAVVLAVAAGQKTKDEFVEWIRKNIAVI
jgi:death on curing protein